MTSLMVMPNDGQETDPRPSEALETDEVVITQLFRQENERPDGVRAGRALEVLADPDSVVTTEFGGIAIILATRHVATGVVPYTLLVVASQRPGGKVEV